MTTSSAGAGRTTFGATAPSTALALAGIGAVLVLIWGILIQRDWHNEFAETRLLAAIALLGLTGAGLWLGQRRLVLLGTAVGLIGFAVWMQQLSSTHTDETGELYGFSYDGLSRSFAPSSRIDRAAPSLTVSLSAPSASAESVCTAFVLALAREPTACSSISPRARET